MEVVDESFGREGRRAAIRVVNHHDVLNMEQVLHGGYRLQGAHGTAARIGHREQGPRVANSVAGLIENVFTGVDLVTKVVGNGLRDFGCTWVEATDHHGLHRDESIESVEFGQIEPGLCPEFILTVFRCAPRLGLVLGSFRRGDPKARCGHCNSCTCDTAHEPPSRWINQIVLFHISSTKACYQALFWSGPLSFLRYVAESMARD